jgi:hypothetical protein
MKKLSVLGVALAASALVRNSALAARHNTCSIRRRRERSNRTTTHTYERGGCEQKSASTYLPTLLLLLR